MVCKCKVPDKEYDVQFDEETKKFHIKEIQCPQFKAINLSVNVLSPGTSNNASNAPQAVPTKLISSKEAYDYILVIGRNIEDKIRPKINKIKSTTPNLNLGTSIKEGLKVLKSSLPDIKYNLTSFINKFANISFDKTDIDIPLNHNSVDYFEFICFAYYVYETDYLIRVLISNKSNLTLPALLTHQHSRKFGHEEKQQRILEGLATYASLDIMQFYITSDFELALRTNNAIAAVLYHLKYKLSEFGIESRKKHLKVCAACSNEFYSSSPIAKYCQRKECKKQQDRENHKKKKITV